MNTKTYTTAPPSATNMLRAALPAIPVIGGLPGIKHQRGDLPAMTAVRTNLTIDPAHLEAYEDVCGFGRPEFTPVTYPHNAVHGLIMALMTDTEFPFAPMGAVHLRNSITQHRPLRRDETFDLAVEAAAMRPHPKGKLVEFDSRATVGEELVWEETMTVFFRGRGGSEEVKPSPVAGIDAPDGVVRWKLDEGLGRRFARVSGDYNPIHLHPLTAKPFGFPRNIAHGMWSKARCLAAMQNRLSDSFTVHVEFKKPVILPTTVTFGSEVGASSSSTVFGLKDTAKPAVHLVGLVVPG